MEKRKVEECLKALEREKIAKGMQCTKVDERHLREMQKKQMYERRCLELEEEDRENMWHQVLLCDVKRKEQRERLEIERKHKEMLDRRKCYDEQISSANKKRREALNEERDKERRRLDKMKQKMEKDHHEDQRRKKEQQQANKTNYIEGHKLKLQRLREEKCKEREIDNNTIRVALEELRQEKLRKRNDMLNQRKEEKIFLENINHQRRNDVEFDVEADKIVQEWREEEDHQTDEFLRCVENERRINKEKAVREYQIHLEKLREDVQLERKQRSERMQLVSRTAYRELQRQLDNANLELKKQIEFRNALKNQIRDNHNALETELADVQTKDWPFTKRSEMFSDVMLNRYKQFSDRKSTNPVHPFKKVMETHESKTNTINTFNLPLIGAKYSK